MFLNAEFPSSFNGSVAVKLSINIRSIRGRTVFCKGIIMSVYCLNPCKPVSYTHLAQRGGSVVTFVRYGEEVAEPIVEEGCADILIAFEKLEALRYTQFLKKDGVIIVNNQRIDPITVVTGMALSLIHI